MIFPCQKEKSFFPSRVGSHIFPSRESTRQICSRPPSWPNLVSPAHSDAPWCLGPTWMGERWGGWSSKVVGAGKVFWWSVKKTCSYCYKTHTIFLKKGSLKKKSCIWITIQNKKIEVFNLYIPQFRCQKKTSHQTTAGSHFLPSHTGWPLESPRCPHRSNLARRPATKFFFGTAAIQMRDSKKITTGEKRHPCGCFQKWWYPTTMGFPTKNDHFGVFWGYHH